MSIAALTAATARLLQFVLFEEAVSIEVRGTKGRLRRPGLDRPCLRQTGLTVPVRVRLVQGRAQLPAQSSHAGLTFRILFGFPSDPPLARRR